MKTLMTLVIVLILYGDINSQNILDTDGLNNLNNVYLFAQKEYCNDLYSNNFSVVSEYAWAAVLVNDEL